MNTSKPRGEVQPLVSLVIACFNMGDRLAETIESVRAQTYPATEIIVVDDGSYERQTLRALERCRALGITVLEQPNRGTASALNAAIRHGAGTLFMPIGDDLIDPPYVAEAVAVMQRDPNCGIVYCRADFFGSYHRPWNLPPFTMKRQLVDNCIFVTSLFRKADWERVGGFDVTMRDGREDHDFIMRVLGIGRSVHRLEGRHFHYRRGETSVNHVIGQRRDRLIAAHARIMRNNADLYLDHADLLWEYIFDVIDERNDLRNRYAPVERVRHTWGGRKAWAAASKLRRALARPRSVRT